MTTDAPPTAIDAAGCFEHDVRPLSVDARWQSAAMVTATLAGMCTCCFGPCLVLFFDALGIGWGPMLCTRCLA